MRKRSILLILALLLVLSVCLTAPALAAEEEFDGYIVCLAEGGDVQLLEAQEARPVPYADGLYTVESADEVEALRRAGCLEYAVPNYTLELLDAPDDLLYEQQWSLAAIGYPALRDSGLDGSGVTIAMLDSGVDLSTEDMSGIRISAASRNLLGDGTHTDAYYRDQAGHGTFVASRIAAVTGNGKGIASIAPGTELMVLRCVAQKDSPRYPFNDSYDKGSGSLATVISGIRYAVDNGADVINLSLGTEVPEAGPVLQSAVDYAVRQGVILVASVGNDGTDSLYFPAANVGVVGVGSVGMTDGVYTHSDFSQVNSTVDVCAPGEDVLGVRLYFGSAQTPAYGRGRGTSFATPVISALAAVAKQAQPALDADGYLALLASTASDCGEAGYDTTFGYGVVNAEALTEALTARSYSIEYVLNGSESEPASLPADAASSYTLRGTAALPLPEREGYTFAGWYEDAAFTAGPVAQVPAGTVGALREVRSETGVTYEIAPVTFYAKWRGSGGAVSSVTVRGIQAQPGAEAGILRVTLPQDAAGSLSELTAADISVTPANDDAVVSAVTASQDGSVWTFTVSSDGESRSYALFVTISRYSRPVPAHSQTERRGAALTQAMDGTPAVPFVSDVSNWFTGADTYTIISCDGGGDLTLEGSTLTYTPGGGDFGGISVNIRVGGSNPDFPIPAEVNAVIRIERQPSTSRVIWEDPAYDLYTDSDITGIRLVLYDNRPGWIRFDGAPIPDTAYEFSGNLGSDDLHAEVDLTLKADYLQGLLPGEHTVSFEFSGGPTVSVTLPVTDSAPRYDVRFWLDGTEGEPYFARSSVRAGTLLTALPPSPARPGMRFTGWYAGRVAVRADTAVTGSMEITASWQRAADEEEYASSLLEQNARGAVLLFTENARILLPAGILQDTSEAADVADCYMGGAGNVVMRFSSSGVTEPVPISENGGVPSFVYMGPGVYTAAGRTASFDDIESHWGRDSILFTAERGLFRGVTASSFSPDGSMTRAMLVTVLYRLAGSPEVTSLSPFQDVPEGQWYTPAVVWAYENRIVNGISVDLFAPMRPLTREQLVTMLYRYLVSQGMWYGDVGTLAGAPDADSVSPYAREAFSWAVSADVVRGVSGGLLVPRNNTTRAQVAAVMERIVGYILK